MPNLSRMSNTELEQLHRKVDAEVAALRNQKKAIVDELARRYVEAEAIRKFRAKEAGMPEVTIGRTG